MREMEGVSGAAGEGEGSVELTPSAESVIMASVGELTKDEEKGDRSTWEHPWAAWVEWAAIVSALAIFSILGVIVRFSLEALFDGVLTVMQDWTALFKDLPANMVGSFFMGFFGFALKDHIGNYSDVLLLGMTTGLQGTITTYASWNQDMADMFVADQVASALMGLVIGVELPIMSFVIGMAAGEAVLYALGFFRGKLGPVSAPSKATPQQRFKRNTAIFGTATSVWLLVALPLCIWAAVMDDGSITRRKVWLGCAVAPPGVWLRWRLARLNLGWTRSRHWAWLPLGTLLTNAIASSLESALAVVDDAVPGYAATWITRSFQFGTLGALSTVSTFVAELYKLHRGPTPWRAYLYLAMSLTLTQVLSFLVYGIPVWKQHYYKAYPPWSEYFASHGTHGD